MQKVDLAELTGSIPGWTVGSIREIGVFLTHVLFDLIRTLVELRQCRFSLLRVPAKKCRSPAACGSDLSIPVDSGVRYVGMEEGFSRGR
jgi:hypothetical protein